MSTESQVKANRKNAKKSTGPKTTEGKAKSAQNAIKHGLTACYNVIEIEDREEFDFFRLEMLDDLYPIGPMQYRLAERIVSLSWRLRRAEIMHDKTIDDLLQKDRDWLYFDMDEYRIHPDLPGDELALGHMAQSDFSKRRAVLDRLIMYERRIENSMYKTMKQLKILKNEPNLTTNVEAKQRSNVAGNESKNLRASRHKNEPISSSTTERQEPRYHPREVSEVNYEKLPVSMSPKLEKMISRIRKNLKLDEIQESTTNVEAKRRSAAGGQNEPNFTPHTPKKPINHSQPQAESTNTHGPVRAGNQSSIINNQLKGPYPPKSKPVKNTDNVIAKRNGGRSEAQHYPRRPIRPRLNKK